MDKIKKEYILIAIIVVPIAIFMCFWIFTHLEIIDYEEEKENEEKVIFLKGSNGKTFFDSLCNKVKIEMQNPQKIGDSIFYETTGNMHYSIEVETNNLNEINYVRIMIFDAEDYKDLFLEASKIEYDGANTENAYKWINDNLGKEAETKIGNANFKLEIGNNGKPILEIFTDGNDEFQKEQMDKLYE